MRATSARMRLVIEMQHGASFLIERAKVLFFRGRQRPAPRAAGEGQASAT